MSSATPTDVAQSRGIVRNLPEMQNKQAYGEGAGASTGGLNERQKMLDRFWRYYRCQNYAGRKTDWNGHAVTTHIETDLIGQSGVIPAGFYDAGQTMPLKFRKPSIPYYLCRVIVARFTGLLFSKKRSPQIVCDDPETQSWLQGFAEATRLWSQSLQMRTYGGAQGSVALGFKFLHGKPYVEVHDARWCTPEFSDRASMTVDRMEKRYQFTEDVRDHEGKWVEQRFWYRRLITSEEDIVWPKVPVEDENGATDEPLWQREKHKRVRHNFGECPIVWVQNMPVEDSIDGDPDCFGIFDIIEGIDELLSQAHRATKANCDPTVGIASDADFDELSTGTGKAIQVEKGGSIDYLEMTGTGIDKAMALADSLEERALTIARCMLDRNEGGPSRAASEVEHNYSSMTEQADIYREQYGEQGIKRLLEMVLRVARKLDKPVMRDDERGISTIMRTKIKLPKRKVKLGELEKKVAALDDRVNPFKTRPPIEVPEDQCRPVYVERTLGKGETIYLKWPAYFTPGLDAISKAVDAAGRARAVYNIIDDRNAVEFIAPYLGIEDVDAVVDLIQEQSESAAQGGDLNELMAGLTQPNGPQEEE